MKLALLVLLLLVSGCAVFGGKSIPTVNPVEVITIEEGNAPTNVWYSLTTKGYENLSSNMAEVKRYLRQVISILKYYREIDKKESKDE